MRDCPSDHHGEPGDPYGCYEEMQREDALTDQAHQWGVESEKRRLSAAVEEAVKPFLALQDDPVPASEVVRTLRALL